MKGTKPVGMIEVKEATDKEIVAKVVESPFFKAGSTFEAKDEVSLMPAPILPPRPGVGPGFPIPPPPAPGKPLEIQPK